ncbi:sigma factor [Crateriforma conspicua]|uniref:sigma factor n=1 Tax=Crateriforma conspicua TaxID=2527996 RepID=UPI0011B65F4B|nr:sigma factor [Crateriforma conspicua]
MTQRISSSRLIDLATPMVERTAHNISARSELQELDVEDIQQELLVHVIERVEHFDPDLGTELAFLTQIIRTGVAMLLRKSSRQRSNPPEGTDVCHLSDFVDGPSLKSEQRIVGMSIEDGDRRRHLSSRDPLAELELSDAIEERIATLPDDLQPIAGQLMTSNKKETAATFGLSRRKFSEAMKAITEHFAEVDWFTK